MYENHRENFDDRRSFKHDAKTQDSQGGISAASSLSASEIYPPLSDSSNSVALQEETKCKATLDFYNIPVTGRSTEVSLIGECYNRVTSTATRTDGRKANKSEIILISGESGTGKSMLATALRERVVMENNGFFVSGKFDYARKDPYSALMEAFTDLCDLVAQQEGDEYSNIAEVLKDELLVLHTIIPNLSRIAGTTNLVEIADSFNSSGKDCFTRFKLSCRKFLNAVASAKHPVVLVLDDLQWADEASVEVFQSLVTDTESKYILFIGTRRVHGKERDGSHVESLIRALDKNKKECLRSTFIQLENFGLAQVVSLVCSIMKTDASLEATEKLVTLILKRTDGLPFFVVKFMKMLQDRNLLWCHRDTGELMYSVSQIQSETDASDNVAEIITEQIQQLHKQVQFVLKLAAVQGFQFDQAVVVALAKNEMKSLNNPIEDIVHESLMLAEQQGLIESSQEGRLKFCHDRIHDCFYFTTTDDGKSLADLHLSVAHVLQATHDDEKHVFSIADQLCLASPMVCSDEEKLNCAKRSLRASLLAIRKSAFVVAAEYSNYGLSQLDQSIQWNNTCYKTTLDLRCSAANACHGSGDANGCHSHLEEVFRNARTVLDANRAYIIQVHSLAAQCRLDEAIDVALHAARQLGVKIPEKPNMLHAIWGIIKTRKMLRKKTNKQLLALPCNPLDDTVLRPTLMLLSAAAQYASIATKVPQLCLSVVLMLQITLKAGVSSGAIYASYGILATVMAKIPEAVRMGELATKLVELHHDHPEDVAATVGITHMFLAHWRSPLHDSLEPLAQAYHIGMEFGRTNDAFVAVQSYLLIGLFSGYDLVDLEKQMRHHCNIMLEFDQRDKANVSLPYWQMCLNLLGRENETPTELTGEAMVQVCFDVEQETPNASAAQPTMHLIRIILCYKFRNLLSLKELLADYSRSPVGHFMLYINEFYVGLAYISLYRERMERAYKKAARKCIKRIRKWTQGGCTNTKPLLALLRAEIATLTHPKNEIKVRAAFDEAIAEARAIENPDLAAMANELASRYFQFETGDQETTEAYMAKALGLYQIWGAEAKVTHIEKSCPWLEVSMVDACNTIADIPQEIAPS